MEFDTRDAARNWKARLREAVCFAGAAAWFGPFFVRVFCRVFMWPFSEPVFRPWEARDSLGFLQKSRAAC